VLTADLRRDWETLGRLVLRRAIDPPRLAAIDAAAREVEAWADGSGPGLHHFERTDHGPRVARSEDFEPHHAGLSATLRSGIIVEILTELFAQRPVLFKEKINYKHPGGGGFAPHQDATAYRFVDHHISVMVPLDAARIESGCLWFCDRQDEILPNECGRIDEAWVASREWMPVEVDPGDVVFFDSYTPHRSETNTTAASRRALYLTYNRASDGDFRDRYYADKRTFFDDTGDGAERVRISVNDDFLGRPV
jgi:ectoine hydroxylase-related dioxygenase (phytanoyl-CoA dioxygenase family)